MRRTDEGSLARTRQSHLSQRELRGRRAVLDEELRIYVCPVCRKAALVAGSSKVIVGHADGSPPCP